MRIALLSILVASTAVASPPVDDDWYTWTCDVDGNPIRFELFASNGEIGVGTQGGMGGDGMFPAQISRDGYKIQFTDTKGLSFSFKFDKKPGEFIPFRLKILSGSDSSIWRCAQSPR